VLALAVAVWAKPGETAKKQRPQTMAVEAKRADACIKTVSNLNKPEHYQHSSGL
jgi:hypothetical protein